MEKLSTDRYQLMSFLGKSHDDLSACPVCGEERSAVECGYVIPRLCRCKRDEYAREIEAESNRFIVDEEGRKELSRKNLESRILRSGFPESMIGSDFEDADREHIRMLKRYVSEVERVRLSGLGLLLYGDTGTGKTHNAIVIGLKLIDRYEVRYTSMHEIFSKYYSLPFEDRYGYLTDLKASDFLIIDDYGAENITDGVYQLLLDIVSHKIYAHSCLILTTNHSLESFGTSTSIREKRLNTRILEACYPIQVAGKNWRREKSKDMHHIAGEILNS